MLYNLVQDVQDRINIIKAEIASPIGGYRVIDVTEEAGKILFNQLFAFTKKFI